MYFLHFVTKVSKEGGGGDFPYVSKIHIWNYFHCHKDISQVNTKDLRLTILPGWWENLEKWIWANQDGKEAWRWGKKAWRRCRNGDWDHQGGIQHWDKQTNVIQKPKHGILCLEHEPYCCQSKWCWPVGCKQKLGGLSLNHLRPEVEWRSYFWQKQCRWWIHYFGTLLYMLLLQPIMAAGRV